MVLEMVLSAQDSPICYLCSQTGKGNRREQLSGKATFSGRQLLLIKENPDLCSLSTNEQQLQSVSLTESFWILSGTVPETLVRGKEKRAR